MAERFLQVVLCTVLWFKLSVEKHCVAKVVLAVWEIFLHENNRNYNSYKFSYEFTSIFFFSFLSNQKQESGLQQIGGLVIRNISVFLFIASCALHERNFLTCYFYWCYSSTLLLCKCGAATVQRICWNGTKHWLTIVVVMVIPKTNITHYIAKISL